MKNAKSLFIIVYLWFNCSIATAQDFEIAGRVVNEKYEALSGAGISVFNEDSVSIKGTVSNSSGFFKVEQLSHATYILNVSFVGYQTATAHVKITSGNVNLGDINLLPEAIGLDEARVQAKSVIYQDGKQLIFPTQEQREMSSNGIALLDRLKLPGILVDVFSKSVTISGEGRLMFCINGREASIQEISALMPQDIVRIEYHQDPGARYKNAAKAIDYIVKIRDSGGYVYADLTNGLLTMYGEDQISAKFGRGKSALSFMYYLACRDFKHLWRENHEDFYINGTHSTRLEKGIPDLFEYYDNTFHLGYDYQNGDKHLNVAFFLATYNQPHYDWESNLSYSSQLRPVDAIDNSNNNKFTPSLNVYYQHPIDKNQTFIANVSGIYNKENYARSYLEKSDGEIINDIYSEVNEKQYYVSFAALYENKLNFGRISSGINYEQSFTKDVYLPGNSGSGLGFEKLYAYSEFNRQAKKLYYRINAGIEQSRHSTGGEIVNSFVFRPSLLVQYEIKENIVLRYRLSSFNVPPSISSLTNYDQAIDSIQIRRGNPFLDPYRVYYTALSFSARKNNFGEINLYGHYKLYDRPIMEESFLEGDKVVRFTDNQKKLLNLNAQADFILTFLKDALTLKIWGGINRYLSEGNNYRHAHDILYYGGKMNAKYKKFALSLTLLQNVRDFFWGETLTRTESGYFITLMYNRHNLSAGVDILNF